MNCIIPSYIRILYIEFALIRECYYIIVDIIIYYVTVSMYLLENSDCRCCAIGLRNNRRRRLKRRQ